MEQFTNLNDYNSLTNLNGLLENTLFSIDIQQIITIILTIILGLNDITNTPVNTTNIIAINSNKINN
jgi:hypothetical protein